MTIQLKCKLCDDDLTLRNICQKRTSNYDPTEAHCADCFSIMKTGMQNDKLVENYSNHNIYLVHDGYIPYWECQYTFNTLAECKGYIDKRLEKVVEGLAKFKKFKK